ncbi:MAG: hypothetical protein ABFD54_10950 [Armatimonadota bacterium]|nr:hypothetical protein [bacterium]
MRKVAGIIAILAFMMPCGVLGDAATDTAATPLKTVGETTATTTPTTKVNESLSASEVLCGHGSAAGYSLEHGGVIPGSEWVYVGIKRARKNVDYTINYESGTIYLVEPAREGDTVRVDYLYSKDAPKRASSGLSFAPAMFGDALHLNTVYSTRALDSSNSRNVVTYGLSSSLKLNGTSNLNSMVYFSSPESSGRMSLTGTSSKAPSASTDAKKDHLFVQGANINAGKAKVTLGFQDVGKDFSGFASMRDSNAAESDIINQLEKEKGISRTNLAAELPTGTTGGFNFAFGRISDANDDISNQAFGYSGGGFSFNFSSREVGKNFTRFGDLKESDRAQMAAEAGARRTQYALQFAGDASGGVSPISGLTMTQIESGGSVMSIKSVEADLGRVKVQADLRTMDPTFDKMSALNDSERTRMALTARQQFQPGAKASDVTAQDKAKINSEAGLNRSSYVVQVDGGAVDTWLTLSNVDSNKGGLNRSAINMAGKTFSAYFSHQNIDSTFGRISSLQPIEQSRFGNEYGMSRMSMGGSLKLSFGDLALDNTSVRDDQGAMLTRRSIDLKNNRLKLHANFQDIDQNFSRILDLSDADRNTLLRERGFKRADYAINFQATKDLNIDTYFYDSSNTTAGQTRGQNRYKLNFDPKNGTKISAFHDECSYVSHEGNLSSYSRSRYSFENSFNFLGGLHVRGSSDTNYSQEGTDAPVNTQVVEAHLESNQKAPLAFNIDTVNTDLGNGKFVNTRSLGVKTRMTSNMALVTSLSQTDREADPSEISGSLGLDWSINKDVKLTMSLANRDSGSNGSQRARQFALNGLVIKRFLIFNNIQVGSGLNTTTALGKQTGCDNAFKFQTGIIGGGNFLIDNSDKLNKKNGMYYHSRILQYETNKDPKAWYHIKFFKQDLITPSGQPGIKRNNAFDVKLSEGTRFAYTTYFGKDGQNGALIPVGGTSMKLTHTLTSKLTMTADYTIDRNDSSNRMARIAGLGFAGILPNDAQFEFYFGRCHLLDGFTLDDDNVFRIKYDQKMAADRYITLSAEKKSGVDKSKINPNEGDTIARIDFRATFD